MCRNLEIQKSFMLSIEKKNINILILMVKYLLI